MAQHVDGVRVVALEGDDGDAVALFQGGAEVDQQGDVGRGRGGHAARDGGFRQSRADRRRRVAHGGAVVELKGGTVGEGDVQRHERTGPFVLRARVPWRGLLTGGV